MVYVYAQPGAPIYRFLLSKKTINSKNYRKLYLQIQSQFILCGVATTAHLPSPPPTASSNHSHFMDLDSFPSQQAISHTHHASHTQFMKI